MRVRYTMHMQTYDWYQQLIKPTWAPPSWLFGPVWTVLYMIIAVSFGSVFIMLFHKKIAWMIALPFLLNVIFNLSFTPIQFGMKNNLLAAVDIQRGPQCPAPGVFDQRR